MVVKGAVVRLTYHELAAIRRAIQEFHELAKERPNEGYTTDAGYMNAILRRSRHHLAGEQVFPDGT